MMKILGWDRSHALLVIADFYNEFWFDGIFILAVSVITTFDKIIQRALLSDLPDLINSCAACISGRVVLNKLKVF
jgi:hypothetical protein